MLFGALLIAPASTFVGCSDYDDDISSLQQQIDVNKSTLNDLLAEKVNDIQSQLEALKKADSDLDAAFKDADAALKQAQEAGDKAVLDKVASEYATVAAAKELVANAKDELQKALDSKAEELIAKDAELTEGVSAAKAAAAAAQSTADQALALAQEASDLAQKNADAIKAVNGELDTQAAKLEDLSSKLDAQATKLGELSTKIDEVKSSLEAQISSLSDEINGKLDEVNSKISAINGQIAALEAFKTAQEGTNTDLQNQIDALVEELNGVKGYLEGKLRVQIEGMIGDAEARIMESVDATNTTIANLKTAYDEEFRQLKARMDAVEAAIDELNDTTIPGINTRIDNLNTDINTLKATLSNVLRSIVFKPELYVGGIESQEYGYMHYNHLTTGAAAAQTGTMDNGASFTITTPRSEWDFVTNVNSEKNVAPAIAVKYHLNPSNAEVPAANLAFISQNAQIINRASTENPQFVAQYYNSINDKEATVYSPVAQNGVLTVGMEVNADKLHALYNRGTVKQGSIFALQATVAPDGKDQLITSDYAQLYTSQIQPFAIAFNNNSFNTTNTCTAELYKDAATALTKVASHAINYKDYVAGKGIDLAKLFDIHYSWTSETNKNTAHAILENGAEKKFGLSYDFKLIDYTAGTNQTSDSKYAEITSNNELLVRRVDANGNTVAPTSDAEARAAIGRRPLVRVRVMEGSKVVLVGFFHLQIVEEAASKVTTAYNFGEQQWTCAGYTGKVTWSHVSDAVLSACGLSSDEFESLYTLTLNGAHAEQYTVTTSPVSGTPVTTPRLGQVVKVTETVGGVTTSVLKWTLNAKELQAIYDKSGHTATIYVQFHRNSANANSLEGHIYFPMTITVTKPAIPTVSAKGNEGWDANNVFAINVGQPRPAGALTKITDYATTVQNNGENKILWSDLDYAWSNSKPDWTGAAGYYVSHTTSVAGNGNGANTGYKYYFVPESNGFTYKAGATVVTPSHLPASAQELMDNKLVSNNYKYKYSDAIFCCNQIYSGSDLICTLNQTNGQVVWNTDNNKAKEILNKNAETKFKVGMVTEHANACDVALPLNYDGKLAMFDFKVQRPINVGIVGGPAEVIDAETTTYDIPLANYLQFTDWRNVNFWNDLHLFYFYEIKGIDIDRDNIETNVNGTRQKLSVAKPEVKINIVGVNLPVTSKTPSRPALDGKLGTITYRTNTGASVVNGYEIYVPIYVTYGLSAGTGDKSLKTELVIKVKPSYQ